MPRSPLHQILLDEIRERGPLTFARFIDLALYHPEHGYYQSKVRIGKAGDFYTSPHVNALFGKLLWKQFREMWDQMGRPHPFQLVELGAGHGLLAGDVLQAAEMDEAFPGLPDYWMVEVSRQLEEQQRSALGDQVRWAENIRQVPGGRVEGCIFANEVLDSFPVHRITLQNGRWRELYVTEEDGELSECAGELSWPELGDFVSKVNVEWPEGIRTEINLQALDCVREIGEVLARGFWVNIDYGFPATEYYSRARMDGTLRGYRQHRIRANPFESPGEMDLTSHVEFTSVAGAGEQAGLDTEGFTDQMHFLMGIGESEIAAALAAHTGHTLEAARKRSSIMTLIHPEMLGGPFKVLIQSRGVGSVKLSGLRNARGKL